MDVRHRNPNETVSKVCSKQLLNTFKPILKSGLMLRLKQIFNEYDLSLRYLNLRSWWWWSKPKNQISSEPNQ